VGEETESADDESESDFQVRIQPCDELDFHLTFWFTQEGLHGRIRVRVVWANNNNTNTNEDIGFLEKMPQFFLIYPPTATVNV